MTAKKTPIILYYYRLFQGNRESARPSGWKNAPSIPGDRTQVSDVEFRSSRANSRSVQSTVSLHINPQRYTLRELVCSQTCLKWHLSIATTLSITGTYKFPQSAIYSLFYRPVYNRHNYGLHLVPFMDKLDCISIYSANFYILSFMNKESYDVSNLQHTELTLYIVYLDTM